VLSLAYEQHSGMIFISGTSLLECMMVCNSVLQCWCVFNFAPLQWQHSVGLLSRLFHCHLYTLYIHQSGLVTRTDPAWRWPWLVGSRSSLSQSQTGRSYYVSESNHICRV